MADMRKLADAGYAALSARDQEAFLQLIHPDAEFTSLVAEAEGQTFRGHDGVRQWWRLVVEALGGVTFEPQEIHEVPGGVVSSVRVSARVGGVEVPQVMWQAVSFRGGKLEWWATVRTRAEAVEALRARRSGGGAPPQRSIEDMSA